VRGRVCLTPRRRAGRAGEPPRGQLGGRAAAQGGRARFAQGGRARFARAGLGLMVWGSGFWVLGFG